MEYLRRLNTLSVVAILGLILTIATLSSEASAHPPQVTFPTLTTTSLTGKVKWQANVSLTSVHRVDFFVDGALRWSEFEFPYQYNGDPNGLLDTTTLSNGNHRLSATATAGGGHTFSASLDVTVSNSAPPSTPSPPTTTTTTTTTSSPPPINPPPSSTPSFPGLPTRPAFSPNRTINVTTQSQFLAAISNLQPGDLVNVSPMTLTGEIVIRANLADYAEIDFASGVRFTGAATGSRLPAVWVAGAAKLRMFGGEITGNGNDGLRIEDSSYVTWQGFTIHDTAGTGLFVQGISRGTDHLDLYGQIYHCGWDYLNLDPHAEKGTGVHAAYLGGGNLPTTTSSFVLDIHDQAVGAAIETGSMLKDSDLWVRAKRITFVAKQQVAGNAIQAWGSQNQKNRVHYLEAEDVTRAVEGDGLDSSAASDAFTIEYARTLRSRLTPYPTYRGLVYGDVG